MSDKKEKTGKRNFLTMAAAAVTEAPVRHKKWKKRRKRAQALAGAAVRIINLLSDHRHAIFRKNL